MITTHVTGKGEMWPLNTAVETYVTYAVNTFIPLTLSGFSPFELVFVRKPPDLLTLAFPPRAVFLHS